MVVLASTEELDPVVPGFACGLSFKGKVIMILFLPKMILGLKNSI